MSGICEGRVVLVTGAGRGLGREYALELARQGAKVVVNDLGVSNQGEGGENTPAEQVVAEIAALGGEAVANFGDVSDMTSAGDMIKQALDTFGDLHAVVNNAGIVRDRMFVSATEDEWDATMKVHLKGHFAVASNAVAYWRGKAKETGSTVDARIINTTSGAGLQGSIGQSAYSTAKGGIAALTLVQAAELARYGITANALAPAARTRMTEAAFGDAMAAPEGGFDENDPANCAPIVAWLASPESAGVTGQVFEIKGGMIMLEDGWREGPSVDIHARWKPEDVTEAVKGLLEQAMPARKVWGS